MKIDATKANRWKFPEFRYVNWKKEAPLAAKTGWKSWFAFKKYWGGRLWYFSIRHYQLQLDFRACLWADMMSPNSN
tara:strand:- start:834 stop:1061 length:228 start_codon:yes stop_codon:yes gene_type:complete